VREIIHVTRLVQQLKAQRHCFNEPQKARGGWTSQKQRDQQANKHHLQLRKRNKVVATPAFVVHSAAPQHLIVANQEKFAFANANIIRNALARRAVS